MNAEETLFHITRTRDYREAAFQDIRRQHTELLAQARDLIEQAKSVDAELTVLNRIIKEMGGRSTENDLKV